jgi:DNA-binding protein HU-beta
MNKSDLVDKVSAAVPGLKKRDVDAVISATLEAIAEAVAKGDKVTLVGFGSFEPRHRKAREGRNPKTGETLIIPAAKIPAFSAGKGFKDRLSA